MQYPDNIQIALSSGLEPDDNGNFQAPEESTPFSSVCRAEVAGDNPSIVGADGNKIEYSWIVYMPKTAENFDFGCSVVITKGGKEFKGSLKQQYNGQFNTRIWI